MSNAIALSIHELPARYQSHPAITTRLWRRCESGEQEVVFHYHGKPSPSLLPVIYQDRRLLLFTANRLVPPNGGLWLVQRPSTTQRDGLSLWL